MSEAHTSRLARLRGQLRGMIPFASGAGAVLSFIFYFTAFFSLQLLSRRDVLVDLISSALASATPRPAFFGCKVLRSWRRHETGDQTDETGEGAHSFRSGVIVNDLRIFCRLHIVATATNITVFYADRTQIAPAVWRSST
ncbi:MAG: hypothetical protein U0V48_05540 [Anaerolineales bacterium]